MEKIQVYTLAWRDSGPAQDPADADVLCHSRVFVDGHELKSASIEVKAQGGDFLEVILRLHPAQIEFFSVGKDDWEKEPDSIRAAIGNRVLRQ